MLEKTDSSPRYSHPDKGPLLKDLLGAHLADQRPSDVSKLIQARFGWPVRAYTIRRLKNGETKTTAWDHLVAIAAVLSLSVEETDQLLRAGGHYELVTYHRAHGQDRADLFSQWPDLSAVFSNADPPGELPASDSDTFATSRRVPMKVAVVVGLLLAVGLGLMAGLGRPSAAVDFSTVEAGDLELEPVYYSVSTGPLRSVDFSPDGSLLAYGGDDGVARVLDVDSGAPSGTEIVGHSGSIQGVDFSPDGQWIATASADGRVGVWGTASGGPVVMIDDAHGGEVVRSVAFSPDGSTLASVGEDAQLAFWDPATGDPAGPRVVADDNAFADENKTIFVTYSPDGQEVATVGSTLRVRFWNPADGTPTRDPFPSPDEWIRQAVYRPDGDQVATVDRDGFVRLYDGADMRTLDGHTAGLHGLAYSPDGVLLATVGEDQVIVLWEADTGEVIHGPTRAHHAPIFDVAVSADGKIATASADGDIGLWTVTSLDR